MGSGVFITGTDTGVGKTFIAAGLATILRAGGYKIGVMKPAETGCPEQNGSLIPQDAVQLKEASGCEEPLERICPYRLPDPLAPSVAAERAGRKIDVAHLASLYRQISAKHDLTIVEGAGGLLVPLLPHYTYADWLRLTKIPLIVVAANRLGAINHALLTLEHASCLGLTVLGYILNHCDAAPTQAAGTNPAALRALTSVPFLGELPYIEAGAQTHERAAVFEQSIDWTVLAVLLRPSSRVRAP